MKLKSNLKQPFRSQLVTSVRVLDRPAVVMTLVLAAAIPQAHGADGAWNADAAGNWSTAGNWNPAVAPGTTAGDVVDLTFDISAARTVTIDTTSPNVGDLNIGDSGPTYFAYTLARTGSLALNLDGSGSGPATVDIRSQGVGSVSNVISTAITLLDDAVFRSNGTASQTISGVITDGAVSRSLTFNNDVDGTANAPGSGQGQFALSAANTYDGGTFIDDVRVSTSAAGAFGTGAITVTGAGQVYFSGGTRSNSLVLNSTGWVETAGNLGALRIENATVTGGVTLQQHAIIGVNANNTGTLSGPISGASNITKVGGTATPGQGVLLLSGSNTGWSGNLIVDRGTVRLNNADALGTGALVMLNANSNPTGGVSAFGATLEMAGGNTYGSGKTLMMVSGTLANNHRASLINQAGSNTWAGDIILDSAQPGGSLAQAQNNVASTTMTLSGSITATGPNYPGLFFVRGTSSGVLASTAVVNAPNTDFAKTETGTWTINSTGNNWRNTIIADGTLALGANDAFDTGAKLTMGQGSATTGRFDMKGFNQTVAGLGSDPLSSSLGHLILNTGVTPSILTTSNTTNDTLKGTLSGNLSVVKNGTGSLTLNHAFSGTPAAWTAGSITVNEGAFTLNGTPAIALGDATTSVVVADGATLGGEGSLGGNVTLGTTTGANLVVNAGTFGALTVGGALTLNGTTQVQVTGPVMFGTMRVVNVPAAPGGSGLASFSVAGFRNPAFVLSASPTPGVDLTFDTAALTWTGAGGGTWDRATTVSWVTGPVPTAFYQGDNVTFDDSPGTNQSIAVSGSVNTSDVTFNNSAAVQYVLTGTSGSALAANLFSKDGAGTVVLAFDNITAQSAAIVNGTLQLGNGGTTGTISGPISNATALVLNHGAGASVTVPGAISGLGTVTKQGAGTTILRGTSTYMGGTTVNGGVLDLAAAGAGGGGGVVVANGTLRVSATNGTAAAQTITLGTAASGTATTVLELPVNTTGTGDAITLSSPLIVSSSAPDSKAILRYPGGTSGASMAYAGAITLQDRDLWIENTSDTNPNTRLFNLTGQVTGTGDLVIDVPSGAARVRLSNASNTFVGDIRLVRGMLQIGTGAGGVSSPIPDTADVILSAGTRLGMGLSDTMGALQGGAADPGNSLAAAIVNPNTSSAGTTTLTIGSGDHGGDYAGTITDEVGTHLLAITKVGTGTQTFSGVNSSYTGITTVNAGVLAVNSVADATSSIGAGGLVVNGAATLRYLGSGLSSTSRALTIGTGGGILDVPDSGGTLAFTGTSGSIANPLTKTGAGTVLMDRVISGTNGAVNVQGGSLILTGSNTYSGLTTVSGGTLLVNNTSGSGTGTGNVIVTNGGTLGGTGTASGLVEIQIGGVLSPGTSPGTLSLGGGLLLNGTYAVELASLASFDAINITGNFNANGIIAVLLSGGYSPAENDSYDIADWTGGFSGTPTFDFSGAALTPGLSWDSSSFATTGVIKVVPEPATLLLGLIGAASITLRRRR